MMSSAFDKNTVRAAAKESYLYPQPEGLLRVQDYLFAEACGCRCVLLRWVMEAEHPLDAFTFELSQLDAADECIGTVTVTYHKRDFHGVKTGEVFVPLDGVAVEDGCASVRVQLLEAVSGQYIYRVKGTHVEAGYRSPEYWSHDKHPGREDRLTDKKPLRVNCKRRAQVGLILPVAGLAVVVMVVAMLFPYIRPYLPRPEEETTGTETYSETVMTAPETGE